MDTQHPFFAMKDAACLQVSECIRICILPASLQAHPLKKKVGGIGCFYFSILVDAFLHIFQ